MTAKRIQRKRTKGWKMPENAVYVGRPTRWGNPWRMDDKTCASTTVGLFRGLIAARDCDLARTGKQFEDAVYSFQIRRDLKGKDLACFCSLDQPCHADVLLEIANK